MGPTSELMEPPAQFEYVRGYEQPTSKIMSDENDTWPAATWVPKSQTENQFNEDVIGPTSEVMELPAQFDYSMSYVQMGYEQPTSQVLPTEGIMAHEYDTWPAATWFPIPQRDNQFNEDVMGPTSEVVETPAQFEYSGGYGEMEYEQPMFQYQMTNAVFTYYYDGWPVGTWVPTLHRDNPFCGVSVGQMAPGYLQYPPQLEWMNPYQW